MRILLHIGLEHTGADRLQSHLADRREALRADGILFPKSPGGSNHTRLFMAVTEPDQVEPLRAARGYADPAKQAELRQTVQADLARDVAEARPDLLILSASQLGTGLTSEREVARLHALLRPLSDDIQVLAHIDEQGRILARHYAEALREGRTTPLSQELGMAGRNTWAADCLAARAGLTGNEARFASVHAPPFWLDYTALEALWTGVFGPGSLSFRPYDAERFASDALGEELQTGFGLPARHARVRADGPPAAPSAATLTRARQLNGLLAQLQRRGHVIPRRLRRSFFDEIALPGEAIAPGSLSTISKTFEAANKALIKAHPALSASDLKRDRALKPWVEAEPGLGFRATQYLLIFLPRIVQATREARRDAPQPAPPKPVNGAMALSPSAERLMPPLARSNYAKLHGGPFAPHNRLGHVNEEALAAAYTPVPTRPLPETRSGNVIVGCMKNEAPYIVEWVAYHRAIGVDNFIIYTNGCEDGTSELLDRLQAMGVLQHRNNDDWKGNSPQQHALNQSLNEDVVKNADWLIHIDVDEFINIRCGNGTLADFFARVPDATNVAMTWRLFGHNGVTELRDELVIEQFDTCAPKYCPKPHTVWGFKTMFRNIGAYEKISCHRPNKLDEAMRGDVFWVNGSGQPMGDAVKDNGWRSSKASIGYDLLQLNHYALRSAESFLIKRQRGRALHVDRSIGINYWVRMDWSVHKDITIKRNIPRVRAEVDRLMADAELAKWHRHGFAWHRAKADELHATPEFQELYEQALDVNLTEIERVAYALALDMES